MAKKIDPAKKKKKETSLFSEVINKMKYADSKEGRKEGLKRNNELVEKNRGNDGDSMAENIIEFLDPTGITSWDDVYRSSKENGVFSGETLKEGLAALPLAGRLIKPLIKSTKGSGALIPIIGARAIDTFEDLNNFENGGDLNTINNNFLNPRMFALGGNLNKNTNNMNELTQFNEGGSHEQNPYGGVPIGMGENGQPNTVEQGETMQNDFVFSDRIVLRPDVISQVGLPKTLANKTIAEATKIIDKQFKDRNSKVDKSTRDAMYDRIAQAQEMIKAEEQAKIAQAQEANSTEVPDMMGGEIPQGMDQFMQPEQGMEQLPMEAQDGRVQSGMQDLGQPMFKYGGKVNKYFLGGLFGTQENPENDPKIKMTNMNSTVGGIAGGVGTGMALFDQAKGNTSTDSGEAALSGGLQGAVAGTQIMPGIGTAIGAGVGITSGLIGSSSARKKAARERENRERKAFYDTHIANLSNNNDTQVFAYGGKIDPKKKHKRSFLEGLRDDVRNDDINRNVKENEEFEKRHPIKENWQHWYSHYNDFKRTEKTNRNSERYLNSAPFRNLENFLNSQKTIQETNPYVTGSQPYAYGGKVNKYPNGGPTNPYKFNPDNIDEVKGLQSWGNTNKPGWLNNNSNPKYKGMDGILPENHSDYGIYGRATKTLPVSEYEAYMNSLQNQNNTPSYDPSQDGILQNMNKYNGQSEAPMGPMNYNQDIATGGTHFGKKINPQSNVNSEETNNNKSGNNLGSLLRYAPAAMNAYQLATLKGPQTNRLQRLDNQYQRQFLDEATYQNMAREQASAARNAIGRSGATPGQMIGAQLGTQLGATKSIADSYNQIRQHNIGENKLRQQTQFGNNQFNIQQDNLEQDINDKNKAAWQNNRSRLLGQLGNDLGGIGKEEVYKDMAVDATGYNWMGKYMQGNPNADKETAKKAWKKENSNGTDTQFEELWKLRNSSSKALGGFLNKKLR